MAGGIITIILAAIGGGALALSAARLARRFIAFGERRFDRVYGDCPLVPEELRPASLNGGGTTEQGRRAGKDGVSHKHRSGGL